MKPKNHKRHASSPQIEYRCPPPCNGLLCRYDEPTGTNYAFEIKCHRHRCRRINYRGNVIMTAPVDFRCKARDEKRSAKLNKVIICDKLLARIVPGTVIEIKCPRCGSIQTSTSVAAPDAHTEEKQNED